MMDHEKSPSPASGPGFVEFVCLIALMMGLNALAIDAMLPALPRIGDALGVAAPNARQWIITAYLLGFGGAQILFGPASDRYGRKPVLLIGVVIYVAFGLVAVVAPTFETLILARVGQGVGAAAIRVLAVSIVRDRYSGRTMARVMSLSFLVFLGVPILAPAIGAAILLIAPWRAIFAVLVLAGVGLFCWSAIRLRETLDPRDRLAFDPLRIAAAFRVVLGNRISMGYTLALAAVMGTLFAFINSAQQIFFDTFNAPTLFPAMFAAISAGMALASILNARLVERLGARLISHWALIGFTTMAALHAAVALAGLKTLWTFAVLQTATMFCSGTLGGNFGAMAMDQVAHIAGMASSVQDFVSTVVRSLAGFVVGQMFNGTVVPLLFGFTTARLVALIGVLYAERGRRLVSRDSLPAVRS